VKQSRISVDFNEMVEPDLVLLSKTDTRTDSSGATIVLSEGLPVRLYDEELGADGQPDNLLADGVVERNKNDLSWTSPAKWCCRIDGNGIRHESELAE
jgi:hypothetical protein